MSNVTSTQPTTPPQAAGPTAAPVSATPQGPVVSAAPQAIAQDVSGVAAPVDLKTGMQVDINKIQGLDKALADLENQYDAMATIAQPGDPNDPGLGRAVGAKQWTYGDQPVAGRTFTSWGDPHEIAGDGLKYDNEKAGSFIKLQSANGDFQLQTRQDHNGRTDVTLNTAAAVRMDGDVVSYDTTTEQLQVNGQIVNRVAGATTKLPGGGSVTVDANGQDLTFTSAQGDVVTVTNMTTPGFGNYLNITGTIGPNRKDGEMRGELGQFHAGSDDSRDLMGPTGDTPIGSPTDPSAIDKFEEAWRPLPGQNLFDDYTPAEGILDQKKLGMSQKEYAVLDSQYNTLTDMYSQALTAQLNGDAGSSDLVNKIDAERTSILQKEGVILDRDYVLVQRNHAQTVTADTNTAQVATIKQKLDFSGFLSGLSALPNLNPQVQINKNDPNKDDPNAQ